MNRFIMQTGILCFFKQNAGGFLQEKDKKELVNTPCLYCQNNLISLIHVMDVILATPFFAAVRICHAYPQHLI